MRARRPKWTRWILESALITVIIFTILFLIIFTMQASGPYGTITALLICLTIIGVLLTFIRYYIRRVYREMYKMYK